MPFPTVAELLALNAGQLDQADTIEDIIATQFANQITAGDTLLAARLNTGTAGVSDEAVRTEVAMRVIMADPKYAEVKWQDAASSEWIFIARVDLTV